MPRNALKKLTQAQPVAAGVGDVPRPQQLAVRGIESEQVAARPVMTAVVGARPEPGSDGGLEPTQSWQVSEILLNDLLLAPRSPTWQQAG